MSAAGAVVPVSAVPNAVPFRKGPDPRRSPGGITKAEREFRDLLEAEFIPAAAGLLRKVLADAMAGSESDRVLFFKVCGLIKKPTDNAVIQEQARALLDAMLEEARARRGG